MSTTLYIQTGKSVEVNKGQVLLKDIAHTSCTDKNAERRCQQCLIMNLSKKQPGSYVVTALELVDKITSEYSNVNVIHIGEPGIVICYDPHPKKAGIWDYIKTGFVMLVLFFGAGFSIMTFNTDVNTTELFSNLYREITGLPSSGFTELELFYSLGIGVGVVFFFNHFSFRKKKKDPSALEVQMSVYEKDVEMTILNQQAKGSDGSG